MYNTCDWYKLESKRIGVKNLAHVVSSVDSTRIIYKLHTDRPMVHAHLLCVHGMMYEIGNIKELKNSVSNFDEVHVYF